MKPTWVKRRYISKLDFNYIRTTLPKDFTVCLTDPLNNRSFICAVMVSLLLIFRTVLNISPTAHHPFELCDLQQKLCHLSKMSLRYSMTMKNHSHTSTQLFLDQPATFCSISLCYVLQFCCVGGLLFYYLGLFSSSSIKQFVKSMW